MDLSALNPLKLFRESVRQVPALRYAYVILAVVSLGAIAAALTVDLRIVGWGTLVAVFLMTLVLLFSRLVAIAGPEFVKPALVLLWATVVLSIAAMTMVITSIFFQRPIDLEDWLHKRGDRRELGGDGVAVSLTSDMTFRQAALTIAGNEGTTVRFPECTDTELSVKMSAGGMKAETTKSLLETLQYRVIGPGGPKYRVDFLKAKGLYEIQCIHN
jgi:hypothetical protein